MKSAVAASLVDWICHDFNFDVVSRVREVLS